MHRQKYCAFLMTYGAISCNGAMVLEDVDGTMDSDYYFTVLEQDLWPKRRWNLGTSGYL